MKKTLEKIKPIVMPLSPANFIDKIDFPTPNKKIEKIISNENLKVVK